jgi:glucose/arabinose dehydrogenase
MKRDSAKWFVAAALMSTVVAVVDHSARPAAQTPASGGSNPSMVFDTVTKQKIRVVAVASGLMHPWSIAFLPDGHTMLVADRSGQLRVVRDGVLDPTPISGLPVSEPFKSVPTRPGMQGILRDRTASTKSHCTRSSLRITSSTSRTRSTESSATRSPWRAGVSKG